MGKRELVVLLYCLSDVFWLLVLRVPWFGMQCVTVVFPDHLRTRVLSVNNVRQLFAENAFNRQPFQMHFSGTNLLYSGNH